MDKEKISISDINKGDLKAFRLFFESFYGTLCRITNKYLQDKDASVDIVQDAFIYFWEKRADIYTIRSAKFYLYKFVRNRSLNYLRDLKSRNNINFETQNHEVEFKDDLIEQETYQLIYKAIKQLPPQGRRVIELSMDGLSNKEVAEQLKISVNTVKTLKKRAYRVLHDDLEENIFILFLILTS